MVTAKRIEICLNDRQMKFLQAMADRDCVSIQQELRMFFWTEFDHCMELYEDELIGGEE